MKILFISYYSELYGANRSLLTLIEYMKSSGKDVVVLMPSEGSMGEELRSKNIDFLTIPYFSQLFYYKKSVKYLVLPFLILATLCVFPYILYRIKKLNVNLIYSNSSAENMGIFFAKFLKKKHISHIREFMDLDYSAYFLGGRAAKKKFINKSDGVVFVSHAVANYINIEGGLLPNQKVVYNGIETKGVVLQKDRLDKTIRFGLVGILDPAKGQIEALEYFSELIKIKPNVELHFYGDKAGSYKTKLITRINQLGLENNVKMHGFVKNTDEIYKGIDILLMFSRAEGFGRVTIEAMQRAIPVIGLDQGGTSELIQHRKNGVLFQNLQGFLDGINFILKDDNRYNEVREFAYSSSNIDFSKEKYCEGVLSFIEDIVK